MFIRYAWLDCDFRNDTWGADPIAAFWIEASEAEASSLVFSSLTPLQVQRSKRLACNLPDGHPYACVKMPFCFLTAWDLSSIDPLPAIYPFSNLWNGDSPFVAISAFSIDRLDDLRIERLRLYRTQE